jgi:hypothetical protein
MRIKQFFAAAAALSGTGLLTTAAFAAGAKVCWEAEKPVSIESPLQKVTPGANSEYSGSGFLEIPWDQNKTKGIGQAGYRINVAKPGVYYIWARTFWANGCGNSIALSVNGAAPKVLGEDGTYNKWHWVGGTSRVQLKAGVNTVVLKNHETGVRVDQFFFCQDGDYTPVNIRRVTQ